MATQKIIEKADYLRNIKGNLKAAIKLLENSLAKGIEDLSTKAVLLQKLGTLYRDIGETKKAYRVYQQALKLAQKDDYKILAADILRCQSFLILKLKNNPKDAEKIAQEALDLVKNLKNKDAQKVQASIFELLGNVYAAQGKENQALKSYQKGLKIAQEIQFPERIIAILGDIANTYLNQNQIDKAQELLEQALVEAEKSYRHAVPALNIRLARLILQQKIMR